VRQDPENWFAAGLTAYIGVVENVQDPLQMGRVQVRCLGVHPERAAGGVPTADLPWAWVMLPTTASGMSGIGQNHDLKDGSWVFGVFLDGRDAQQPVVFGSFAGRPGFSPLQREYLGRQHAISSAGPGGIGGLFQTGLAGGIPGLGSGGKFGSTVGSVMNMANLLKNDDAVKMVYAMSGIGGPGPTLAPLAAAIDRLSPGQVNTGMQRPQGAAGVGDQTLANFPDLAKTLFGAGGATVPTAAREPSPLAGANMGSAAGPGEPFTAQNMTAQVRSDFDAIVATAPQDVGMITIHCSATKKNSRYSLDQMRADHLSRSDMDGKGIGYHLVIDETGQLIRTRDMGQTGSHTGNMNRPSIGGQSMQNIGICLIGGLPESGQRSNLMRLPLDSKFHAIQFDVLGKLVDAFIRRFPQLRVAGHNEFSSKECPTFSVPHWMQNRYNTNSNVEKDGTKRISNPSDPGSVPGQVIDPVNDTTQGGGGSGDDQSQAPSAGPGASRGYQGGPHHPVPTYAATRQSDVPAPVRTNALSGGPATTGFRDVGGGPEQQYLAKIQEPTLWQFKEAREADSLDARSVPREWAVPLYNHGGEYGMAHMVKSTEGGNHILLDDTPGNQKVEVLHPSGSMIQLQADGSGIFYIRKDRYQVVIGDDSVGVMGSVKLSIGGDFNISVQGNVRWDVTGKYLVNVAGELHELVRGDSARVTEGSSIQQTKKNAVTRVGKDHDVQVGGKRHTSVRGTDQRVVRGNSGETVHGDSVSHVEGNRSEQTIGATAMHAKNLALQSQKEAIISSGGNFVLNANGKMTAIARGDQLIETKAGLKVVVASDALITATGAIHEKSGGVFNMQSGGAMNLKAGGNINADGTQIHLNSGGAASATAATGTSTANVEATPAQLTPESTPADSASNINSEQVTQGEMDANEAQDEQGQNGQEAPGSINSGGGATAGGDLFQPTTGGGPVGPASLGNFRGNACDIANDLVSRGWSRHGAAAMTGALIQESSLNPQALGDAGTSFGMAQWRGPRLTALQQFSQQNGLDYRTREAQVRFIDHEARGSHSGSGGAGMINATDMAGAIRGAAAYERFQGWDNGAFSGGAWGNRAGYGMGVYNECFGGNETGVGGQQPSNIDAFTGGANNKPGDFQTGVGEEQTPAQAEKEPMVGERGVVGGDVNEGTKISRYFTLGDLCPTSKLKHPAMINTPRGQVASGTIIKNLSALATNVLDRIQDNVGNVTITSGYRSPEYNAALRKKSSGVAKNSDHIQGQAADIKVAGKSPREVAAWIERNIPQVTSIGIYKSWVHVGWSRSGNGGRIRRW